MGTRPDDIEMNAMSGFGYVYILSASSRITSLNHGNRRNQNATVLGAPAAVRPPFLVKLTGYRIVGLAFLLAALSKFILSLSSSSHSTTTNRLDLVFGGIFAVV
jgi:hypothetical protein